MAGLLQKLLGLGSRPAPGSGSSFPPERDDSDWKALFDDASTLASPPPQIEEAQSRLMGRLSRVYQLYDRRSRQQAALLRSVIEAVDYCEGLRPRPAEVAAVRELLLGALLDQGVAPWTPAVGEPVPQGCEPVAEENSAAQPARTVVRVVTPGYVWSGSIILRRPRVVIARGPAEAPARDRIAETGTGSTPAEEADE